MEAIEAIRTEVMPIPEQAKLILVKDTESMTKANQFFLIIKGLRKRIAITFDPMEKAAKEAKQKAEESRKTIVAEREKLEVPLIIGENWLNGQMTRYKLEQDRIRNEEVNRLRLKAIQEEIERRKKVEEEKLAEAAMLEQVGMKEESEQLISEAIQEQEAPITVKVVDPEIPKVVMEGATIQTNWKFKIIEGKEHLIPRSYMMPDEVKIGALVRSQHGKARSILGPGIEIWPDTKTRSTGR